MANTFNCPSCGAPQEIDGDKLSIVCKYCGDTVAVPEEFRPHPVAAPSVPYLPPEDADEPLVRPTPSNTRGLGTGIIIFLGVIMFFIMLASAKKPAPPAVKYNYASSAGATGVKPIRCVNRSGRGRHNAAGH